MIPKIVFINTHLNFLKDLLSGLRVPLRMVTLILVFYYLLTIVNAIVDGVAMLLLVSFFTGQIGLEVEQAQINHIVNLFVNLLNQDVNWIFVLTTLFFINLILRVGLAIFDGYIMALIRKKLQCKLYENYLKADWAYSRSYRIGDMVGIITQEALVVSKYINSAINSIYFLFSAITVIILGAMANLKVFLCLGLISLPIIILMKNIFRIQAKLSKEGAKLRNDFSSVIADRFNGLMQIHVEKNHDYHYQVGIRTQKRIAVIDLYIGICQAFIGAFSLFLPFLLLIILSAAIYFFNFSQEINYGLYASLGILGIRVTSQMNGFISALGNLSRLSGSLIPVVHALRIKNFKKLEPITGAIKAIELRKVSYKYSERKIIDSLSLDIITGHPLVIYGQSGVGKTTLVNIISGLLVPNQGDIRFIADDGRAYYSDKYYPKIGFVTQDIYLFDESLRQTLSPLSLHTDQELWDVLNLVRASDFVRELGGLDAKYGEGGKRLSGGQRRRIGLARMLLQNNQILIFDEPTSGLDEVNIKEIMDVVKNISKSNIVILITHDVITLPNQVNLIL